MRNISSEGHPSFLVSKLDEEKVMLTSLAGYIFGTNDDKGNENIKEKEEEKKGFDDEGWVLVPKDEQKRSASRSSSVEMVPEMDVQSLPDSTTSSSPNKAVIPSKPTSHSKVVSGKKLKESEFAALTGNVLGSAHEPSAYNTRSATQRANAIHAFSGKGRSRKSKLARNPSGACNDRKAHAF